MSQADQTREGEIYDILLHDDVFGQMEALPALDRASVLRTLWTIRHYGATGILPGRVKFSGSAFTAFAPQRHFTARKDNGAFLHGFWHDEFTGEFLIHKIERVVEGKNPETGRYCFLIPGMAGVSRDPNYYKPIDKSWIDKEEDGVFVKKAASEINAVHNTITDVGSAYIESAAFYRDIDDILELGRVAEKHGSSPLWTKDMADYRVNRITLGRNTGHVPGGLPLERFIQSLIADPGHLVFVQFIDEQDVLSRAQDEFLNMMAYYVLDDYLDIDVTILDVVVRDACGMTGYLKDFREFYDTNCLGPSGSRCNGNPRPFVMLFGRPKEAAKEKLLNEDFKQDGRLLDFDLFYGCRKASNDRELDDLYKKGFRRAAHGVMRYAGLVADGARGFFKDFRGFPEDDLDLAQYYLEKKGVVIKVHDKKGKIYDAAAQAYYNLKLSGCPYITLILADGPEDVVEIYDHTDTYTVYSGHVTGSEEFYAAIEVAAREQYATHPLGGAQTIPFRPIAPIEASDEELAVLNGLGHDKSRKEIAFSLGITPEAVDEKLKHLCKRWGVSNLNWALLKASEVGLLKPPSLAPGSGTQLNL